MTIFDGFEDLHYFNTSNVLILIILFIFFYYITNSIYQSIILSISMLFIHYKYLEDKRQKLQSEEIINQFEERDNLDDIELEPYQNEIVKNTFPKSKYINDYNNKSFENFLFLNQEFYYYNPQVWINIISNIDKFLEIYEDIIIDSSRAGISYNQMKDLRDLCVKDLISIKINCPDNKDVLKKINLSINDLEQLMNKYLFDVYVKNVKYIKQNGLNNQSVIINPNLFDN